MSTQRHEFETVDPAIGELFRELLPQLLRYAEGILGSRYDAEEAVQDAFLAASRAGRLDEPRPWLFRVTRNAAIDQLRRRRHLVALDADGDAAPQAVAADPHHHAELAAELLVLRRGLDGLPEQQRSALVLRELSGLGYREIASVIEVSEANVKVLIFRARQALSHFAQAARLSCGDAQLALSAHADGEASRAETTRARLHAASCGHCREFAGAVRGQRVSLGLLVPVAPLGHGVALAVVHAAVGAKAGGGLGGLFGLKAALATAAAVVVVSTGAVVAEHTVIGSHHGGHGRLPAARPPTRSTSVWSGGTNTAPTGGQDGEGGQGPSEPGDSGSGAGGDGTAAGDGAADGASSDGGTSAGGTGDGGTTATSGGGDVTPQTDGTATGREAGDRTRDAG